MWYLPSPPSLTSCSWSANFMKCMIYFLIYTSHWKCTSCSKDFVYSKLASYVYEVTVSRVVQRLSCVCVEVLYFLHKSLVPQYLSGCCFSIPYFTCLDWIASKVFYLLCRLMLVVPGGGYLVFKLIWQYLTLCRYFIQWEIWWTHFWGLFVNPVYFLVQAFINLKNKGRIKSELPVLVGRSNLYFRLFFSR
jgi:hypothetical protein